MAVIRHRGGNISKVVLLMQGYLDEGVFLDVSKGVEKKVKLTRDEFLTAIRALTSYGYIKETCYIDHVNDKTKKTKLDVLAPKGSTPEEIWDHIHELKIVSI